MKRFIGVMSVLVLAVIFTSCSKNNPVAPNSAPEKGKMVFALDTADNIASGSVTISKGAIIQVLPISIANHSGSVTFSAIQVGTWNLTVQLFDSEGVEIYSGTGTALVTKDQTTTAHIRVEPNTGHLIINVDVENSELIYTIAFGDGGYDGGEVYLVDSNANNLRLFSIVTNWYGVFCNYSGGRRMLTNGGPTSFEVYLISLDGDVCPQQIAQGVTKPKWSWNGGKIAGVRFDPVTAMYRICTMNPDGTNLNVFPLTMGEGRDYFCAWTINNRLVYTHANGDESQYSLYSVDAEGNDCTLIKALNSSGIVTDCSVDNAVLLNISNKIYSINLDGTGLTPLTAEGVMSRDASFSADGKKIVYSQDDSANNDRGIYLMDRDGSNKHRLSSINISNSSPCFVY